jgi:hypothetical protein
LQSLVTFPHHSWPRTLEPLQHACPGNHAAGLVSSVNRAECVRLGVPQVRLVMEAEEPGPGGEVGGDVRGEDPSFVDLPGFRGYL